MGAIQAQEMAEMLPIEQAIGWHLQANHYPPIPQSMVQPCIDAIDAANEGDWDREIPMPAGVSYKGLETAPAHAIISQHHLDFWLEGEDD